MKEIRAIINIFKLNKEIGKDLRKIDKRDLSNNDLQFQIEKGKVILDNINILNSTFISILFILSVMGNLYIYPLTENVIIFLAWLFINIFLFFIPMYHIGSIVDGLKNARLQLEVNNLLADSINAKVKVIVDDKIIHKFNSYFKINHWDYMIIIDAKKM